MGDRYVRARFINSLENEINKTTKKPNERAATMMKMTAAKKKRKQRRECLFIYTISCRSLRCVQLGSL